MRSMIRTTWIVALGWGVTLPAASLSIRLEPESAVRDNPIVAWVEIEAGQIVRSDAGEHCGARYTARVIRGIKGVDAGERIEFGHFTGHRVGGQYFVFLQSRAEVLLRTTPGVMPSMMSPVPYLRECRPLLPALVEVAEGVGTIPVINGDRVGYRQAVSLGSPPYVVSASLARQGKYEGSFAGDEFYGNVQLEAEAFHDYLRSIAGPAKLSQPAR